MSTEQSERVENLVVGGGVVGLAIAAELLRRERQVLVVDRGRPRGTATMAAGGMLAPISETGIEPPALIDFGRDSLARYPAFVEWLERLTGLSCRYRPQGTLWVARDRDDLAELQQLHEAIRGRGLSAREVGADEVRMLEPHLSSRILGGLLVDSDHQVDPRSLSRCLERAVRALGGQIVSGVTIEAIDEDAGRVRGVGGTRDNGREFAVEAERVILATGAWTGESFPLPAGVPASRPIKGQVVRLSGSPLIEHVVRTPDAYLIPRADGELLIGATVEEVGFQTSATAGPVMDLLRHGWEVLPGIYELELSEISVGLRSAADDQLPVIGSATTAGLFLAYGHFRNGVLLAPSTAHHLAELMLGETTPALLEPFRPARLGDTANHSRAV